MNARGYYGATQAGQVVEDPQGHSAKKPDVLVEMFGILIGFGTLGILGAQLVASARAPSKSHRPYVSNPYYEHEHCQGS